MEISCKLDLNITDVAYFMVYDILKTENYNYFHKDKRFSLAKQSFKSNEKSYYSNQHESNKRYNIHERNNNIAENSCTYTSINFFIFYI